MALNNTKAGKMWKAAQPWTARWTCRSPALFPSPLSFPLPCSYTHPQAKIDSNRLHGAAEPREGGTHHAIEAPGGHHQLCAALLSGKQKLSQQRSQTPTNGPIKTIHLFLANCMCLFHWLYTRSVVGRNFSPALKIPKLRDETQRKARRESLVGKNTGKIRQPRLHAATSSAQHKL